MLKRFFKQCLTTLLPYHCILCDAVSDSSLDLCKDCQADLPFIKHGCQYCNIPLAAESLICGTCLKHPPLYYKLLAAFCYQHPLNYLIAAIKFHNRLNYTQVLGYLLAKNVQSRLEHYPKLIIPVPLHKKRLAARGYNQALEIARPVSKLLHIPIDYQSCSRIKATAAQTDLKHKQRARNVKNAFHICQDFEAKHVAIIDDVVTTGSTVNELSKILKAYGVEHVDVWCCARTHLD